MEKKLSVNPWLGMWVKPRQTIRTVLDERSTNYRFLWLCLIYGLQYMFQASQFMALGQSSSLLMILLFSVILAIPVGYIVFNVMSFFYFLLGKIIKGKGSFKEVRAATYWSSVPLVVSIVVWVVLMVMHGNNLFVPGYEKQLVGMAVSLNVVFGFVQIAIGIWGLVILLHALGEVQGFSAWMALLNVFLGGLAIFILLFLVGWVVSALTHVS